MTHVCKVLMKSTRVDFSRAIVLHEYLYQIPWFLMGRPVPCMGLIAWLRCLCDTIEERIGKLPSHWMMFWKKAKIVYFIFLQKGHERWWIVMEGSKWVKRRTLLGSKCTFANFCIQHHFRGSKTSFHISVHYKKQPRQYLKSKFGCFYKFEVLLMHWTSF